MSGRPGPAEASLLSAAQLRQIIDGATDTAIISTDKQASSPAGASALNVSSVGPKRRCWARNSTVFSRRKIGNSAGSRVK